MPAHAIKVALNPALLRWARKSAGYSLPKLAELLKKPVDEIESWENGTDSPTIRDLEKLAKKVKRPLSTLFLPKPPFEPSLPNDFRVLSSKEPGHFNPETLLAFRKARALASEAKDLLDLLNIELKENLPRFQQIGDDLEEQASRLRGILGVTIEDQIKLPDIYAATDAWRDGLFNMGVFVFQFPMSVEDARGFSLEEDGFGIIGLSSKDAAVARCFSIFHEVCHLCIGKPGVSAGQTEGLKRLQKPAEKVEAFCDSFSAAFLLPIHDDRVKGILHNTFADHSRIDLAAAAKAADKLKVSKYALLRRALDSSLLDSDLYWHTFNSWKEIDKQSSIKRQESGDALRNQISARGKWFASMVFEALDTDRISSHEAGEYLNMQPKFLDRARDLLVRGK